MRSPSPFRAATKAIAKPTDDVDLIVEGIREADELPDAVRLGRHGSEGTDPPGMLTLVRMWRSIDAALVPDGSMIKLLTTRFPDFGRTVSEFNLLIELALKTDSPSARAYVTEKFAKKLRGFSQTRAHISATVEKESKAITTELQGRIAPLKLEQIEPGAVAREVKAALDELENRLHGQLAALRSARDVRPGIKATEATHKLITINLLQASSSRLKAVRALGDPEKLGAAFAAALKSSGKLPPLLDGDPSALFYKEALGVVAAYQNRKILKKLGTLGMKELDDSELRSLNGIVSQMRGLINEEAALRIGAMQAIFQKRAFEVLGDFPAHLRGRMTVEFIDGPLWTVSPKGKKQFGDGCMLLTDDQGRLAVIGLGEMKSGFDETVFQQMFEQADQRALAGNVTFVRDGKEYTRSLTRQFDFDGDVVTIKNPPIFVYGQSVDTSNTNRLKAQIEADLKSSREVYKVELPYTRTQQGELAWHSVEAAAKLLAPILVEIRMKRASATAHRI